MAPHILLAAVWLLHVGFAAPSVRIFDIDYGTMHTCGRVGIRFADRCSAIGRGMQGRWIVTAYRRVKDR